MTRIRMDISRPLPALVSRLLPEHVPAHGHRAGAQDAKPEPERQSGQDHQAAAYQQDVGADPPEKLRLTRPAHGNHPNPMALGLRQYIDRVEPG